MRLDAGRKKRPLLFQWLGGFRQATAVVLDLRGRTTSHQAAGALWHKWFSQRGRQMAGLHASFTRQPNLEAISRRNGLRHLALQFGRQHVKTNH